MKRAVLLAILCAGCSSKPTVPFREVAEETGLKFNHFTGAAGDFYMPEIVGGGVALIDYDGDGDLDVYLVQGWFMDPGRKLSEALYPVKPGFQPGNKLFRNELIPTGKLQFTDVTERAGVGLIAQGMGVAVGDYNNDGKPDLFVTAFGKNVLYRNNGDGTFTDVTAESGVGDQAWSTSAAFCDYDGDGRLDLFVAHYVNFPMKVNPSCRNPAGDRDYCGPKVFRPVPSRLFHNLGNGKFEDVTVKAGLTSAFGAGLGVSCADFNKDGKLDFYVANDQNPNNLWINKGDGVFEDQALMTGTAYSSDGKAQSGMGIATGDTANRGAEDLFVTNLMGETNSFFRNEGRGGMFHEASAEFGLAAASLPYTGFGAGFFDYDNDGLLDLYVANGAVETVDALRGTPYPYRQKNRLYHNEGGTKFIDVSDSAGPALALAEVSRGAAFGDLNNDGRLDVVVTNNNGPVRVLLNQTTVKNHYLQVALQGVVSNRAGQGMMVGVLRKGKPTLWRRSQPDGSYISSGDPRAHFGLGSDGRVDGVVVQWSTGKSEVWRNIETDRTVKLREGTGSPATDSWLR